MRTPLPLCVRVLILVLLGIGRPSVSFAAEPEADPVLTALIDLGGKPVANLGWQSHGWWQTALLHEGEKFEEAELQHIDWPGRSATVVVEGRTSTVHLAPIASEAEAKHQTAPSPTLGSPSDAGLQVRLILSQTPIEQTLAIHSELSGLTVLRPNVLPTAEITVSLDNRVSRAAALRSLEEALSGAGIKVASHGGKFLLALPSKQWQTIVQRLPALPPSPPDPKATEAVPRSFIDLRNVPVAQVLPLYAQLTGRARAGQASRLPAVAITFVNKGDLTKAEACYALETCLAINGLKIRFPDDKSFDVVPAYSSAERIAPPR